jgi:hypothetical protein|tara:strand:- start:3290 stop:3478 length:189 start_codon:yes stop_codon:yes gene_type:complete
MDDKYIPQHKRLAMGKKIVPEPMSHRDREKKVFADGERTIKYLGKLVGLRGGGAVKKTGIKK